MGALYSYSGSRPQQQLASGKNKSSPPAAENRHLGLLPSCTNGKKDGLETGTDCECAAAG
jgi:hypothetical protein